MYKYIILSDEAGLSYKLKWYGEGEGDAGGDAGGEGDAGGAGDSTPKTYSQEEFDKHSAGLRRKYEGKLSELSDSLNKIKESNNLTAQEKEALESQINRIKEESLTTEQKLKRDLEATRKSLTEEKEKITKELEALRGKYHGETIHRAISDAAVANNAFSPEQIVALLRPHTRLAEELDDNKEPTGNMVPLVNFEISVDDNGKPVMGDISVTEAVAKMLEKPEKYGNLFKSDTNGGLSRLRSDGTNVDTTKMDMDQYIKGRREGKIQLK